VKWAWLIEVNRDKRIQLLFLLLAMFNSKTDRNSLRQLHSLMMAAEQVTVSS
jgi:hypothetical protein